MLATLNKIVSHNVSSSLAHYSTKVPVEWALVLLGLKFLISANLEQVAVAWKWSSRLVAFKEKSIFHLTRLAFHILVIVF